jgi:hypothetical protein
MNARDNGALLWLIAVAGLVLGGIVTIAGLVMLENGPQILIAGVIVLAFGAAAFFVKQARAPR